MALVQATHINIIRLAPTPLSKPDSVRPAFDPLFDRDGLRLAPVIAMGQAMGQGTHNIFFFDRDGFPLTPVIATGQERDNIEYNDRPRRKPPLDKPIPHLHGLGALVLKARNLSINTNRSTHERITALFTKRPDNFTIPSDEDDILPEEYGLPFGVSSEDDDSRLYFAFLEPFRRMKGTISDGMRVICNVEFFIHIYLSGYAAILVRVTPVSTKREGQALFDAWEAVQKCRPWTQNPDIKVKGRHRFLNGPLRNVISKLRSSIFYSVSNAPREDTAREEWFSAYLVEDNDVSSSAKKLFPDSQVDFVVNIQSMFFLEEEKVGKIVADRSSVGIILPELERFKRFRLYQKYWHVYEFTILKRKIIYDLRRIIRDKRDLIGRLQVNPVERRLLVEKVHESSKFLLEALDIIRALDDIISVNSQSFYRGLYSEYSDAVGLSELRVKAKKEYEAWHDEVAKLKEGVLKDVTGTLGTLQKILKKLVLGG